MFVSLKSLDTAPLAACCKRSNHFFRGRWACLVEVVGGLGERDRVNGIKDTCLKSLQRPVRRIATGSAAVSVSLTIYGMLTPEHNDMKRANGLQEPEC